MSDVRRRVEFVEVSNPMLKFMLEDGTELLVKMNLMQVVRTDKKLPDGQWAHEFKFVQNVEQLAPEGKIDFNTLKGGAK